MAKRKRAKLRRGKSARHGKTRKAVRTKAAKRTVAKTKPKKAARRIKRPVAGELIEQTSPSVTAAMEDEENPE
jgi:hypothetical protein